MFSMLSSKDTSQTDDNTTHESTKRNIVKRHHYYDELIRTGDGTPRFICIAYVHNKRTGQTKYGAAIFRQQNGEKIPHKKDLKKMLRITAYGRLEKNPIYVTEFTTRAYDLHQKLRHVIRKEGVHGKPENDTYLEDCFNE